MRALHEVRGRTGDDQHPPPVDTDPLVPSMLSTAIWLLWVTVVESPVFMGRIAWVAPQRETRFLLSLSLTAPDHEVLRLGAHRDELPNDGLSAVLLDVVGLLVGGRTSGGVHQPVHALLDDGAGRLRRSVTQETVVQSRGGGWLVSF